MTRLADIAPCLARARDAWIAEDRRLRDVERGLADRWLTARRLVDHRELQLLRAGTTGSRSYVAERQRKLDRARCQMRWLDRELKTARRAITRSA